MKEYIILNKNTGLPLGYIKSIHYGVIIQELQVLKIEGKETHYSTVDFLDRVKALMLEDKSYMSMSTLVNLLEYSSDNDRIIIQS